MFDKRDSPFQALQELQYEGGTRNSECLIPVVIGDKILAKMEPCRKGGTVYSGGVVDNPIQSASPVNSGGLFDNHRITSGEGGVTSALQGSSH